MQYIVWPFKTNVRFVQNAILYYIYIIILMPLYHYTIRKFIMIFTKRNTFRKIYVSYYNIHNTLLYHMYHNYVFVLIKISNISYHSNTNVCVLYIYNILSLVACMI